MNIWETGGVIEINSLPSSRVKDSMVRENLTYNIERIIEPMYKYTIQIQLYSMQVVHI